VVFFNVRNVNYKGYKRQVENEYYFEDGGRIVGGKYYAKGSDKGEKVKVPGARSPRAATGAASSPPAAPATRRWPMATSTTPTTAACSDT
jgi:hypothetical protein